MYLSLHQDSGIQNLIKSSDNETYTSHHDCKFICYRNTCHNTVRSGSQENGNKYVLYEERTDNGAVCHLFQAQQANGCLEKPMVRVHCFAVVYGTWKKSKETRNRKRHTKRVNKYRKKNIMTLDDF